MSAPTQTLSIRQIQIETDDARTFELDVPQEHHPLFRGRAGQFLRILIPGDLANFARSYSLSSSPEIGEPLRFTVKRVTGGSVSNRLVSQLRAGDLLRVDPPAGSFTLRNDNVPLLLIAGGSGITPVFSLLKTALHTTTRKITLLYTNRNRASVIFAKQIEALQKTYASRFTVISHASDEQGFFTEEYLRELISSDRHNHIYVCGPATLIDKIETAFGSLDCSGDRELICERFIPQALNNCAVTANVAPPMHTSVLIRIDGNDYSFSCSNSENLVDAALNAGVPIPYSCKEGHCGACKGQVLEGEVRQNGALALTKRDHERGYVLACCSVVHSASLTIDYV
ncbi:MAG TPA: ferredoxin--NADP reductase [Afipia sp.]